MQKYSSKQSRTSKKNSQSKENGGKCVLKNKIDKKNNDKIKKSVKVKKLSRSKIIKKLDVVFSQYIRLRDSDSKGIVTCPLCGGKMYWKEAHNMHFVKRSCYLYRWDETNCHAGDYRCNVILKGNYIEYTRFMQNKYGIEYTDLMISKSKLPPVKIKTFILEDMINIYTKKIIDISNRISGLV